MKQKIAIFYVLGQYEEWWEDEFFIPQMDLLKRTGLYDACDFIDVAIINKGKEKKPLPYIPDKVKNITFMDPIKGKESDEQKLKMWEFCNENPEYKVFHFHTNGIGYISDPDAKEKKDALNDLMNFCNVKLWKECVNLLNWYDCVGAHVLKNATYFGGDKPINIYAPHFPGDFWWANASYISKLNPNFLSQDVSYKYGLVELFIGSGNPKVFEFQYLPYNPYGVKVTFSEDELREKVKKELEIINDCNVRVPYP
jgi:hypothetical protein